MMIILGFKKLDLICLLMMLFSDAYPLNIRVDWYLKQHTVSMLTVFRISIVFLLNMLSIIASSAALKA